MKSESEGSGLYILMTGWAAALCNYWVLFHSPSPCPSVLPLFKSFLSSSSQICCCWSFRISCSCPAEQIQLWLAFLISITLLQVEVEEVAGSDAKYQGLPLQRPEVIALRQRRRESRDRDSEAFFFFTLLYLVLESLKSFLFKYFKSSTTWLVWYVRSQRPWATLRQLMRLDKVSSEKTDFYSFVLWWQVCLCEHCTHDGWCWWQPHLHSLKQMPI